MKILKWILFAGHDRATYKILSKQLAKSNRARLLAFSIFFIGAVSLLLIISFVMPTERIVRLIYVGFMLVGIAIVVLAFTIAKKYDLATNILIYVFIVFSLAFGILVSSLLSPIEISAAYMALLLMVPQLFIDKPYRIYSVTFVMNIVFMLTVYLVKDPVTWRSDFTNAIIFYLVSDLFLVFNVYAMVTRFLTEKKVNDLAATDQLTGLLNRNSFETAVNSPLMDGNNNIYCVYIDINGLHDLNNLKGHEEGDKMLVFIAKAVQHTFEGQQAYRIGGDEFVVLARDYSPQDIVNHITSLRNQIDVAGYHAAIGYFNTFESKTDLKNAIRVAESLMYKDKKAYYDDEGKKPRRMHK